MSALPAALLRAKDWRRFLLLPLLEFRCCFAFDTGARMEGRSRRRGALGEQGQGATTTEKKRIEGGDGDDDDGCSRNRPTPTQATRTMPAPAS